MSTPMGTIYFCLALAFRHGVPDPWASVGKRQGWWKLRKGQRWLRRKALTWGTRARGTWMWPSHLRTTLPFLDSTRAASLQWTGGEEAFEAWDEELLGDARYGSKVLELRDFVDDVDEVDPLLAAVVAEVDGVDAHEEIARELGMKPETVRWHRAIMTRKLREHMSWGVR